MTDASTIESPTTTGTDFAEPDDHERMAHIVVPASKATEAILTGAPCTALCGKVWTPSRDPERFPVCPTCIETWESIFGVPWPGRR